MRVSVLALALVGLLAACAQMEASVVEPETGVSGHFGAGMHAGRVSGR